jgi:hypothetical protein
MNIGIYLDSIGKLKDLSGIETFVNNNLSSGKIKDASIFYDDVGPNNTNIKCGMFNGTDLWNFSGSLVIISSSCLFKAMNIVNNVELIYYYGWENKTPLFTTIGMLQIPKQIICKTQEDADYLYRISGKRFNKISEDFNQLTGLLL